MRTSKVNSSKSILVILLKIEKMNIEGDKY